MDIQFHVKVYGGLTELIEIADVLLWTETCWQSCFQNRELAKSLTKCKQKVLFENKKIPQEIHARVAGKIWIPQAGLIQLSELRTIGPFIFVITSLLKHEIGNINCL